jgi:hypothetical protein
VPASLKVGAIFGLGALITACGVWLVFTKELGTFALVLAVPAALLTALLGVLFTKIFRTTSASDFVLVGVGVAILVTFLAPLIGYLIIFRTPPNEYWGVVAFGGLSIFMFSCITLPLGGLFGWLAYRYVLRRQT